MTDTEIVNPVAIDEVPGWVAAMMTTFLDDPATVAGDEAGRVAAWDPGRTWGARSRGRWVATLRTLPRRVSLPGTATDLAANALTNVTVAATHRRQGLLTRMLTESLADGRERGEPVSILVAAEWPIYGRFGYAPSVDSAKYTVRTREPGARLVGSPSGSVRQVDAGELAAVAPTIFDTARRRRAGGIDRPSYWWDRELGQHGVRRRATKTPILIVYEGPDGIDGYLSWTSTGEWELGGSLGQATVNDLFATSDEAYRGLWHYLLSIDVVDQIHLDARPVDEPLHWLLADGRTMSQTKRMDWVWLRILDIPAALSARRYAVEDSLVLEVIDPDDGASAAASGSAGYAAGRYLLEGGPDGAECVRTTRTADLEVHQRGLATGYFGGTSLTSQRPGGLVSELTSGALRRADAMFATSLAPWCATLF